MSGGVVGRRSVARVKDNSPGVCISPVNSTVVGAVMIVATMQVEQNSLCMAGSECDMSVLS